MNAKRNILTVVMLVILVGFINIQSSFSQSCNNCDSDLKEFSRDACTVVIVGKKASTDGSVISTHTCDCGVCDWTWRYVPPKDHEEGDMRKIYWFNQFKTTPPDMGLKWDAIEDNFLIANLEYRF